LFVDDAGKVREPSLTLSAQDMPLVEFLRWVSDRAQVSVIAEQKLDDRRVSVDVVDVPVSQLLTAVARRVGVQLNRTGNVYFLGQVRPEDRGILVRKVVRLGGPDLQRAVDTLLSEHGRALALQDGVVVVGDTVEVLAKVAELLDGIEAAPIDTWVVQFDLVSINEESQQTLGLDLVPALEISAMVAAGSQGALNGWDINAGLDGLLQAERTDAGVEILAKPTFLMVDGARARHSNADTVPIFERAVSDQGTVTTQRITYVDVGLIVEVQLREVGNNRASLDISVDLKRLQVLLRTCQRVAAKSTVQQPSSGRVVRTWLVR